MKISDNVTNIDTGAFNSVKNLIVTADSIAHEYVERENIPYILIGEAQNIETDNEIKKEETWDISENGDKTVIAKWTLENKTLTISGKGKMKNWILHQAEMYGVMDIKMY